VFLNHIFIYSSELKIYNTLAVGRANGNYSAISILSPSISFLMVLNGAFRLFLYLIVYYSYSFDSLAFELLKGTSEIRKKELKLQQTKDSKLEAPLQSEVKNSMHIALSFDGELRVLDSNNEGGLDNMALLVKENNQQKAEISSLKSEIERLKGLSGSSTTS